MDLPKGIVKSLLLDVLDCASEKKEPVVARSVKVREEWREAMDASSKFASECEEKVKKMFEEIREMTKANFKLKKKFWNKIEIDLDEFNDMRWNQETDEIEILED